MRNRILYICIIFLISFLFGFDFKCDDDEKDPIKLLVTCNTEFDGSYIFNSADPVGFGGTTGTPPYSKSGSTYYCSIVFNDLDNIIVDASINRTGGDTNSYSLTIRIFKDDSKVKEETITSASTTNDTISGFTYTYDETPSS